MMTLHVNHIIFFKFCLCLLRCVLDTDNTLKPRFIFDGINKQYLLVTVKHTIFGEFFSNSFVRM